jgi:glycosyltransferase involved in cell wall biosynthesis
MFTFKMKPGVMHIGLLWDSKSDNMGDAAIGLLLQRALTRAELPWQTVDLFNPDVTESATLIIGGGELIRSPGDPFYDVFRVPGRHILNTVGVLDGVNTRYLDEYRLVSVRSQADCERLGRGQVVPCLTLLFGDYLAPAQPLPDIPQGAIGINLNYTAQGDLAPFIDWLRRSAPGPIVWLSATHYNADDLLLRELAAAVPHSILLPKLSPDDIFRVIGKLSILVSSSYHAGLFAYAQGVPLIGFQPIAKLTNFLRERQQGHAVYTTFAEMQTILPQILAAPTDLAPLRQIDLANCRQWRDLMFNAAEKALSEPPAAIRCIPADARYDALEKQYYHDMGLRTAQLVRSQIQSIEALQVKENALTATHQSIQQFVDTATQQNATLVAREQSLRKHKRAVLQRDRWLEEKSQQISRLQSALTQSQTENIRLTQMVALGQQIYRDYQAMKNRRSLQFFERTIFPLKNHPWVRTLRRSAAKTQEPLRVSLDTDIPQPFLVGPGTIFSFFGWCYHPEFRIRKMQILLNGKAYPVLSHSHVREDVLEDQVPKADRSGNSLNSGFEAMFSIPPIQNPIDAALGLRARLENGQVLEAPLGVLKLQPTLVVEQPKGQPRLPHLAICMATYNPPLDLFTDQVDSIRKQTFADWLCIINDDCSDLESYEAICQIAAQDSRFIVYRNETRQGFYRNFEICLMRVPPEIEFVSLADQDDHWYPDKLEATLHAFAPGVNLVYCDQHIVTRDDQRIADTYWTTRRNNYTDLAALIFANTVTGAASIFRRSLLDRALPFPPRFWDIYHDNWLACIALASGRIAYIDRPLYAYRQHSGNVIGHFAGTTIPLPTRKEIMGYFRQPRKINAEIFQDLLKNYQDYRGTALRWTYLARFVLLRVPHSDQRALLQMLSTLDHSLYAWAYQVGCAVVYKRSTFGYEWRGLRNTFGKWWVDRHYRRQQAAYTELRRVQYESRILNDTFTERIAVPADSAPKVAINLHPIDTIIAPLRLDVSRSANRRINVVLSTIDFRYFFGGYLAMFNLAMQLDRAGYAVRVVLVQKTDMQPEVWRKEFPDYPGLTHFMDRVEISYHFDRSIPLTVHPQDGFVATSWWTAQIVQQALHDLDREGFLYLVQDYEPMFYPAGSLYALAQESYTFRHFALFSTEMLRTYFKLHQLGVFNDPSGEENSIAFQNAIPRRPIGLGKLKRSGHENRKLLFYARPEDHAQRNLYELGSYAIADALKQGVFDQWELYGIGSVSDAPALPIPGGGRLTLLPKLNFRDYHRQLAQFDLGISLMLTPHPSLVPLDMAAAGMLAITNTFETKSAQALTAISPNIIPVTPTLQGIRAGIALAVSRLNDYEARAQGANLQWASTWDEALGNTVMERIQRYFL